MAGVRDDDAGAGASSTSCPTATARCWSRSPTSPAWPRSRPALERSPLPGQRELVPAARTVLVLLDRAAGGDRRRRRAPAGRDAARRRLRTCRRSTCRSCFDGPDLAEVAELTGRAVPALVAALVAVEFTVAFSGFAPGFGYLTGLPEELHVPRRATPRTRVPAGSVGLAGPYAGAYPRPSPGGWQLVGRTDAVLFDVDRDDAGAAPARRPGAVPGGGLTCSTVLAPGPLATVQDGGRAGWASIGVPRSGAADRGSADLANRLVGNRPDAAVVEVTAGGLRLRAERTVLVAVTGAPAPLSVRRPARRR